MVTPNVLSEEQLLQFLEKNAGDRLKMELLAFWGRHPSAKFTRGAISCALDCKRSAMDRALKDMVATGLVDACTHNGVPFYSLTTNEEKRLVALQLAALGWDQRSLMARRVGQWERSAT